MEHGPISFPDWKQVLARAGQRVSITIEGVGQLENVLLAEELV